MKTNPQRFTTIRAKTPAIEGITSQSAKSSGGLNNRSRRFGKRGLETRVDGWTQEKGTQSSHKI